MRRIALQTFAWFAMAALAAFLLTHLVRGDLFAIGVAGWLRAIAIALAGAGAIAGISLIFTWWAKPN